MSDSSHCAASPEGSAVAASASKDTLGYWEAQITSIEMEQSKLRLKLMEYGVKLNVAKKRHRQLVLERCLQEMGPLTVVDKDDFRKGILDSPEPEVAPQKGRPEAKRQCPLPAAHGDQGAPAAPVGKKPRSFCPVGVCKSCHRLEANPGKLPGVPHTYSEDPAVGVCKRAKEKRSRGRPVSRKQQVAVKVEEPSEKRDEQAAASGLAEADPDNSGQCEAADEGGTD